MEISDLRNRVIVGRGISIISEAGIVIENKLADILDAMNILDGENMVIKLLCGDTTRARRPLRANLSRCDDRDERIRRNLNYAYSLTVFYDYDLTERVTSGSSEMRPLSRRVTTPVFDSSSRSYTHEPAEKPA